MRVLVALEHHFFSDDRQQVWCDRIISYDYLKRYLEVFDEVYVCARFSKVQLPNKNWNMVSGEGVKFIPLPEFTGISATIKVQKKLSKIIKSATNIVDCFILRVPSIISISIYRFLLASGKPIALEMMINAKNILNSEKKIYALPNEILNRYVKCMCKKADGVSYVTESILQRDYPCRAYIHHKGGFTEHYSSIDMYDDNYFDQHWKEQHKPAIYKIIHTGYMDNTRKGHDISIATLKLLIDEGYNVQLSFIGDGQLRSEFETYAHELGISDRIIFCGYVNDRKKLTTLLKNSHLFIMPTRAEGLPRAIIEAMAVSLPCVSSDVDGIPELIESRFLVHGFNPSDYATKLKNLIDDWNLFSETGERNYNVALNYHKSILDARRKHFYSCLKECAIRKIL